MVMVADLVVVVVTSVVVVNVIAVTMFDFNTTIIDFSSN